MDLASITSSDIPTLAAGFSAARNGEPFNPNACSIWQQGYLLHPSVTGPVIDPLGVVPFARPTGLPLSNKGNQQ